MHRLIEKLHGSGRVDTTIFGWRILRVKAPRRGCRIVLSLVGESIIASTNKTLAPYAIRRVSLFYFNLILLCHQCLQNNNTTLQVSAMKCKQITLNMTFTDLRKCTIPSLHNLLIKLLGVSYVNKACLSKAPFVACLFDITHGLSN